MEGLVILLLSKLMILIAIAQLSIKVETVKIFANHSFPCYQNAPFE